MVEHPRHYQWSSYCVNAEGRKNEFISPHEQYLTIDKSDIERRKGYRALFKVDVHRDQDEQIREATNGNFVLGNTRFQEEIATMLGRRVTKGKSGRPKRVDEAN